jgi:hypothetical protein
MLRAPIDTKQIQAAAAEIYRVRSDGQDRTLKGFVCTLTIGIEQQSE